MDKLTNQKGGKMKLIQMFQFLGLLLILESCVYQRADMKADLSVDIPQFKSSISPNVVFDTGHGNFHDINTTYRPFATLLSNDGILVRRHQGSFTENALKNVDLLIIANATTTEEKGAQNESAFSDQEIATVSAWIQSGGALLLIADHDPFGSAAASLAKELGVRMKSVWTVDTLRNNKKTGKNTWLEFSRGNGGLGEHSILQSGNPDAAVSKVMTYTGQSLSFDTTWTSILQLSNSAQNYYSRSDASVASLDTSTYFSAPGESQLIARSYGDGRIVIAGEAAIFTAQEVRIFLKTMHAGFNYEGYDNKRLVLNIIHWLLFKIN
jgi:hypothetical protein